MARILLPLVLLGALAGAAEGQQIKGSAKPGRGHTIQPQQQDLPVAPARRARRPKRIPAPLEVIPPKRGFRVTNRVLFVVDVSGSMQGQLQEAVENVLLIVQTPTDDLQVGLITFNHQAIRWKGKETPCKHAGKHSAKCVRPGWARVPDHYRAFLSYLTAFSAGGMTVPAHALAWALADPEELLTIVLVTDGDFSAKATVKSIASGQAWRRKHKMAPAQIMVWGVGPDAKQNKALRELVSKTRGGLWVHGGHRSGPW
jgi:Mg-chelatase subunit ChlD